jgi:hypothetical protein
MKLEKKSINIKEKTTPANLGKSAKPHELDHASKITW